MKQRYESEQFVAINDNMEIVATCQGFHIKRKMRGREQDSGETERESVLEAEHCRERGIVSAIK